MGTAAEYRCQDCGHQFGAGVDFSYGFLGEVVTPVGGSPVPKWR